MLRKLLPLIISIALIFAVPVWAEWQEGLVGHWPMNKGSGDKVVDASGNDNDGDAQNTNWVDGLYGKALNFNGTDSVVDIPYSKDMTPIKGATISAWVFPTDATRGCVAGQFEVYGIALQDGLLLKSVVWGADWKTADAIPMGEWSYIAMTWNVDSGERMIFLNSKLLGQTKSAAPIPQFENNFGIGFWVGWPTIAWGDDTFAGIIDDVKLWKRVLTEEEIDQASLPVQPQGRLAATWGKVKQIY